MQSEFKNARRARPSDWHPADRIFCHECGKSGENDPQEFYIFEEIGDGKEKMCLCEVCLKSIAMFL